jgi:hypothetical protein
MEYLNPYNILPQNLHVRIFYHIRMGRKIATNTRVKFCIFIINRKNIFKNHEKIPKFLKIWQKNPRIPR